MHLTISALSLTLASFTAFAAPPYFYSGTLDEARRYAAESERLLLVKGTAEWCVPCKQMERTTFADEAVKAWLQSNAVTLALDVDESPEHAAALRINVMPTLVLFRGETEIGRVRGYRNAGEFRRWLGRAEAGELPTPVERDREDVRARLDGASDLLANGELAEATDEFVWLWENMLEYEPAMYGVRLSFMASNINRLIHLSDAARAKFEAIRDEDARLLRDGEGGWDTLHDWLVLHERVFKDRPPIVEWVKRVRQDRGGLAAIRRYEHIVFDVLVAADEWKLLGELIPSADAVFLEKTTEFNQRVAMARKRGRDDRLENHFRAELRAELGRLHAALLAADRDADAWRVLGDALNFDDSAEMREALVVAVIRAGQSRPRHEPLVGGRDKLETLKQEVLAGSKG